MNEDRRRLCQIGGVALAGCMLPSLGCVGDASMAMEASSPIDAGPAAQYLLDDAIVVQGPNHRVYICRDAAGLYAMSADCTHAHCLVEFTDSTTGFSCPCHMSAFDYNGVKISAPAPSSLPHYQLTITDGKVIVDPSQLVAAATRTAG